MRVCKPLTPLELSVLKACIMEDTGEWGDLVAMRGCKKYEFKRLAIKYLKWLSNGQGVIKFNPGGPAVSGEATLKNGVYVVIQNICHGIMYRVDEKGGNLWVPASEIGSRDWYDAIVNSRWSYQAKAQRSQHRKASVQP